jgi:hypothetical protein
LLKIKRKFDLARKLLGPARIQKPDPVRVEKEKKPNPVKYLLLKVLHRHQLYFDKYHCCFLDDP